MTATISPSSAAPMLRQGRSGGDLALRIAVTAGALTILAMLATLLVVLFVAALPSIHRFGPGFIFSSEWRPNALPVLKLDSHGHTIRDPRTAMKVVDHYRPAAFG